MNASSPSPHEPLLTEEELKALIGDDIAAIAPQEQDPTDDGGQAGAGEPL